MAVASQERLRGDLVSLLHSGRSVRDFSLSAARILKRAVPFDGVCVLTLDPATLLPTGEVVENGLPGGATARLTEIELGERDFLKFSALARMPRPAAGLSQVTGGDLDRSLRHRELKRPNGFGDELRAALVDDSAAWGGLTLLREAGSAHFTPEEADLVASVSQHIAEGVRRAMLMSGLSGGEAETDESAGLLLLGDDNSVELANPAAERFIADLLMRVQPGASLPPVVTAVASRARVAASPDAPGETVARARVQTASGQWLLVRGSVVGGGSDARTAVMIEPAGSPELAPLIADAYGLTPRERAVTQLVAQGCATDAIAERLHLSPWTVQDHLKAIFEKVGVGSRGELTARLFFEHYAPRLADG